MEWRGGTKARSKRWTKGRRKNNWGRGGVREKWKRKAMTEQNHKARYNAKRIAEEHTKRKKAVREGGRIHHDGSH